MALNSQNPLNDLLEQILDSLPLAMFLKDYSDDSGRIVLWNSSAVEVWGLKSEQVIGKTDADLFPKEQAEFFKQKDLEALRGGRPVFIGEERADSPVKGRRVVRTWKVPIGEKYLLGLSQDITEQKDLESELEKQKALSFHAAKLASLGEVAGGIAHEINNPMAIILGLTSKMNRLFQTDRLDKEEASRLTQAVESTVRRITGIVDGLRKLSRDGSSDKKQVVDLASIVDQVFQFCGESIRQNGVSLEVKKDGSFPVLCNQVQISQVLVNLVNNANQAISALDNSWIRVELADLNGKIVLSITDSGNGISPEIEAKLFQPFFTTKEIGTGTGLGLSISKGIVEAHSGRIYLDRNCPNTRFVIEFNKESIQAAG